MVVWKRQPRGEWRIAVDSFSTDLPAQQTDPSASLYKWLGGYDAIAAVVDDLLGRLIADPQQARFFTGVSADSHGRIRQLIVDQLCAATGGPCVYIGRSMKAAHAGLGITESDWQATAQHLAATLDKFKAPPKEKGEVLAAVSALQKDIVEK